MGQQQAQTNNTTPNKTLVTTSPIENNLHTVTMRRPLYLNGRSEESKHNLEIPVETELAAYFAQPLQSKVCSRKSPHTYSLIDGFFYSTF
jgi:hypothetical protein